MIFNQLLLHMAAVFAASHAVGDHDEKVLVTGSPRSYRVGESFRVECLNRTTDTGEHITDERGELEYIPFPTCKESGRPLELIFGSEKDVNCTIPELSDPLFHLLEFYIHNDAPLTCRVPATPLTTIEHHQSQDYTMFQIALSGTLQLSHLHINPQLNVIMHTTTGKKDTSKLEGQILAAAAYSLPPTSASPKLIIGDPLPLQFAVRWYSARTLPPSTSRFSSGLGGHVHISTVMYCLLSFFGGVALSLAYFRGIELPKRMRRYGFEKLGVSDTARSGYAFPGKRD